MNLFLSLNKKFLSYSPNDLINKIIEFDINKNVKGIELCLDISRQNEYDYVLQLVKACNASNFKFQMHAIDFDTFELSHIFKLLDIYGSIASFLHYPFNLTIHPLSKLNSDNDNDKRDTEHNIHIFYEMMNYVKFKKYNIDILIENLNILNNDIRDNIFEVQTIVSNVNSLHITWDIGHQIFDGINDLFVQNNFMAITHNIHLHDINATFDHSPFDYHKVDLSKVFGYLNSRYYDFPIVIEIGIDCFYANSFEGKFKKYIEHLDYINNYNK